MSAITHDEGASWRGGAAWFPRNWWAWIWLAALIVAGLTLGAPTNPGPAPRLSHVEWAPAADNYPAPVEDAAWRPVDSLDTVGTAAWVRARFVLTAEEASNPSATLVLAGLFSARVNLNGMPIGAKGQPGFTPETEAPGPIDTALPIAAAARTGENELLLLISTHHAHYRPNVVLQAISVQTAGVAPRRPLQHYALAVAQSGVLAVLALALILTGCLRKDGAPLAWAGVAAGLLLAAMAAEMVRALWSYPYAFHFLRMLVVWAGLTGFMAALFAASAAYWRSSPPWRTATLVGLLIGARMMSTGAVDAWSIASLATFTAATLWIIWPAARRGDAGARALSGVLLVLAALSWFGPVQLLDNGVYVLGVLAMAPFAWEGLRPTTAEPKPSQSPAVATLRCEDGAIPCAEIVWIRAAGNYLEIKRTDGVVALLRGSLSQLGQDHAPIVRVHRSHAVNINFVDRLVALTGSKYELRLHDGTRIPASRREAGALRGQLRTSA